MNDKEKFYFNLYKDKSIGNSEKLHKELKNISGINISLIYREVVNYQVKRYGMNLTSDFVYQHSNEEWTKLNMNKAHRERNKRK